MGKGFLEKVAFLQGQRRVESKGGNGTVPIGSITFFFISLYLLRKNSYFSMSSEFLLELLGLSFLYESF